MEILYRQPNENKNGHNPIESLGAMGCMVKYISHERDRGLVTKKRHHHTGVEIHIILKGRQKYEVDGREAELEAGEMLTILPNVPHLLLESEGETVKYAMFFGVREGSPLHTMMNEKPPYTVERVPERLCDSLAVIHGERRQRSAYSSFIISGRTLECILTVMRSAGMKAEPDTWESDEDERLTMAKQYIGDNVRSALSVPEIASYCHIGEKQLTRIFKRYEGKGAAEYIRERRYREIERLLADTDMPLSRISEIMGFSNEYYFNSFFKRMSGMSPGEYRKTV